MKANGHKSKSASQEAIDLARLLEVRGAERDAAELHLLAMTKLVLKLGGYMSHDQQRALQDAKLYLIDRGLMKPREHLPWNDKP